MVHFHQTHWFVRCTSVVNRQPLILGGDRRPDILTSQTFMDRPDLVQQFNITVRADLTGEMDATARDRQLVRQSTNLLSRQTQAQNERLLRNDRQSWQIVSCVPGFKLGCGPLDMCHRAKVPTTPEASTPQAMDTFDPSIPLGLIDGDQDRFHADIQAQPENGLMMRGAL